MTKIAKEGVSCVPNYLGLANKDVIITMVPATQHVCSLLRGENGLFKHAKKGSLIIDCSTIDPLTSKELAKEALSHGYEYIIYTSFLYTMLSYILYYISC